MQEVPDARRRFEHEGKEYEVWSTADPNGTALAVYEDDQQVTLRRIADPSFCNAGGPGTIEALMDVTITMFRAGLLERLPKKAPGNS